jgi:hypothetical protein
MIKHTRWFTLVIGIRWSKFTIGIDFNRRLIIVDLLPIYIGLEW